MQMQMDAYSTLADLRCQYKILGAPTESGHGAEHKIPSAITHIFAVCDGHVL